MAASRQGWRSTVSALYRPSQSRVSCRPCGVGHRFAGGSAPSERSIGLLRTGEGKVEIRNPSACFASVPCARGPVGDGRLRGGGDGVLRDRPGVLRVAFGDAATASGKDCCRSIPRLRRVVGWPLRRGAVCPIRAWLHRVAGIHWQSGRQSGCAGAVPCCLA